jgi:limonene-1,2-epoxide hydrolase
MTTNLPQPNTLTPIIDWFETLSPERLAEANRIYTEDAWFKDPFNEVRGVSAIRQVFAHMYQQVEQPRFAVNAQFLDGRNAMLVWRFSFRNLGAGPQSAPTVIHGSSQLQLAEDGRIAWHRDYWDTGEELYAKLPLLGVLIRWLQRKLRAPQ